MKRNLELYIDGRSVGMLRAGPDSYFPWFVGTFVPSEHFAKYEQLFLFQEDATIRPEYRCLRTDKLRDFRLTTADLIVEEEEYDEEHPAFLHALDFRPDGTAMWRIGPDPLPDCDEE